MLNGKLSLRSRHVPGGLFFGPPAWDAPVWPARDPSADHPPVNIPADTAQLLELLHQLNFTRYDIWTPSLSDQLLSGPVEYVIFNLIPPQPESIMPRVLSEFELPRLESGLNLIRRCVSAAKTWVAAPRNEPELRYQWRAAAKKNKLLVRPIVNRYPLGHPSILLRALLGIKLKDHESPSQYGVVLLDPITCWMLGCWIETGTRPNWRPVELFTHNAMPVVIAAPLGESLAKILAAAGIEYQDQQCVINGMMAGDLVDPLSMVLEPWMQMISIRPPPTVEKPVDCIRCGWCVSACPVGLNPAGLMAQVRVIDSLPAVSSQEASACITCGLCSYVCPSRLPLAVTIGGMKHDRVAAHTHGGAA